MEEEYYRRIQLFNATYAVVSDVTEYYVRVLWRNAYVSHKH